MVVQDLVESVECFQQTKWAVAAVEALRYLADTECVLAQRKQQV